MPWLRLWVDILDDPDLDALPKDTCWAWTRLLAVAKRNDPQGQLPPAKRLAVILREPQSKVTRYLNELMSAGLVDEEGGVLVMHNWARWQPKEDRTNAARQAKFKANQKSKKLPPSALPQEGEEETERRGEQFVTGRYPSVTKSNAVTSPPPPAIFRTGEDPDSEAVCRLAEEIGGDVSWAMWASSRMKMGDTPAVLKAALSEAVNAGKVNQSYVGKIAARFASEGIPAASNGRYGKPSGRDAGPTNQPPKITAEEAAKYDAEVAARGGPVTRQQLEALRDGKQRAV